MELAQRLDDYGKPAWIGAMVLGFVCFWPLGLAILFYLIWSGRMGCSGSKYDWSCFTGGSRRRHAHRVHRGASSGNAAFDEYRAETLKRLEDEFDAFQEFLEQLRMAKDKQEFDAFMASRRQGGGDGAGAPAA